MTSPARMLVVEDEPAIAFILESCLAEAGFIVDVCNSGDEAMAALDKDPSGFQVLLTDIQLPQCDGWAIAHRARELAPGMHIIYVTGDSAADWPSKGVPDSVLIQKPFVPAQILTAVSTLLNRMS